MDYTKLLCRLTTMIVYNIPFIVILEDLSNKVTYKGINTNHFFIAVYIDSLVMISIKKS